MKHGVTGIRYDTMWYLMFPMVPQDITGLDQLKSIVTIAFTLDGLRNGVEVERVVGGGIEYIGQVGLGLTHFRQVV